MSAEKKIDRLDKAFAERFDANITLLDVIGDHDRRSEIICLVEQYGSRCAGVVEAKAAYVAMEPTEPTEPMEPTEDTEVIDLSALERLDRIEGKFVAACGIAYEQEQRLRVVESTLAASEDVRENMEKRMFSLAANINNHMQRIDGLEANLRVITEKEAKDETNRQLEEDTQKAILSGKQ